MANLQDYLITVRLKQTGVAEAQASFKQLKQTYGSVTISTKEARKAHQDLGDVIQKVAARALVVAPIWMAIRSAMLLIINTTKMIIDTNIKLDDNLNKLKSTLSGTTTDISRQMTEIKDIIVSSARDSTVGINTLAEAMYNFKKSGNTLAETMTAFPALTDLMATRLFSAQEAIDLLDTGYDLFNKTLDKNLTISQKYYKIADIIVAAHQKWNIGGKETLSYFEKIAPILPSVSEGMEELVGIFGYLSDKAQRGAKTGTSLVTTLINAADNAEELAEQFYVYFDSSKPIELLPFLKQIQTQIQKTYVMAGKFNPEQTNILSKLFGKIRGSAAPREIIASFDDLIKAITEFKQTIPGASKALADLRKETIPAQMERFGTAVIMMAGAFGEGIIGAQDFAKTLKELNDNFMSDESLIWWHSFGYAIRQVTNEFALLGLALMQIANISFAALVFKGPKTYLEDIKKTKADWRLVWKDLHASPENFVPPSISVPRGEAFKPVPLKSTVATPKGYMQYQNAQGQYITINLETNVTTTGTKEDAKELAKQIEEANKKAIEKALKDPQIATKIKVNSGAGGGF